MTALLRAASPGVQAALAGGARLWQADLFAFTLAGGDTYNWCTWDTDLMVAGVTYTSKAPWLERSSWNVANTMEVPTLTVFLRAFNTAWEGGANIKSQIVGGLFDGAAMLFSRAYMTSPLAPNALGAIPLFGGKVGGIEIVGTTATLTIKGKVNDLDQNAPRNLYQTGCNHAFCDVGCTLSRASFTAAYVVGSAPTSIFVPWSGSAPGNAALYQNGTITITSGPGAGQSRTIASAGISGVTLEYPLYVVPAAGDAFTAFQGCSKDFDDGSGQDCTARSNTVNFRGYPFIPPPNSAY